METGNPTNPEIITQDAPQEEPQQTFTQDDVNRIVAKRVAKYADYETLKEKAAKFDEAEEASKSELQKAQDKAAKLQSELDGMKKADGIRQIREKVSNATGVPVSLITAETEEAALEQANAIKQYATPGHPVVRDGGEVSVSSKQTTAEQFADWFEDVMN